MFEANLTKWLAPFVAGRVFPDFAPISTTRPYITYQQIGGDAPRYIDDNVPNVQNALMQINIWTDSRGEAADLARSIETALIEAPEFVARPASAMIARAEEDLKLYGAIQDYDIWYAR